MAMNPAILSPTLSTLFPPGAVAAELRDPGDPGLLLPAEGNGLGRAVPQRLQEFAAGRLCARRALAEFGIVDFAIEAAEDRRPIWPDGMVGSITHTAGFCAAVVAERRSSAGLGIDTEVIGEVNGQIWSRICVSREIDWLHSLPASQQTGAVALIFSAKEAFYKCWYPLLRERLDFQDVTVTPEWNAADGSFRIHVGRSVAVRHVAALPLAGRYVFHEGFVSAGVSWAADPPQ
ncbi:MAG: 4'-phosphopantetheinyl transferase superfamily protein [Pseudomonadota bacterium]|nr:4'-phosphopantetheinyl transferase superfamily protein [Pseudomonadota bacterium]